MKKHLLFILLLLGTSASAQLRIEPNVKVSSGDPVYLYGDFWYPEEVSIAIDRVNPGHLAAGANINYLFSSDDAGASWKTDTITSTFGIWGDPCLLSDGSGNIYYAHLSGEPGTENWLDRMTIQVSTDGGKTFSNGAFTGLDPSKDQDKEWLSCDRTSSPHAGNIYISWTEFDLYGSKTETDSSRILFSRSTDQGATWSDPIRVSDKGGDCLDASGTVEGATTAVGPNGEVYISWSGPEGIYFDRSLDGGRTFGKDQLITPLFPGWDLIISGIYRCSGFGWTLCDVSSAPTRGNIYIMFNDKRNGAADGDIFLIRSSNGGNTWTPPKKVNDDTGGREQFFPSATIDQTTGNIYVVFYDRREHNDDSTDVYLARSTDGGETFQNFKISDSAFLPTGDVFLGDYIHIDAFNKNIYPIWTRIDGIASSVWMAHIIDTAATAGVLAVAKSKDELSVYPNPANRFIRIQYTDAKRIVIADALGRTVMNVPAAMLSEGPTSLDISHLAAGMYNVVCETNDGLKVLQFIVSH